MKCRNCGKQLDDDAKFCTFCGASQNGECGQFESKKPDDVDNGGAEASESSDSEVKTGVGMLNESVAKKSAKRTVKQSAIFLAKWLGGYVAALIALLVIALAAGYAFGTPSSMTYRVCAVLVIALFIAVPYSVAVIALAIAGELRHSRIAGAIKRFASKKPVVFKGCCAVGVIAFLVAIFPLTSCPHSDWNHVTCTEPASCVLCGETKGDALGHDWVDATCVNPKTCSRCGETEGEAKGHVPGEWKQEKPNYVDATITTSQKCSKCGETIDSKSESIASFVDGEVFSIPASDFVKRMDKAFSSISGCSLKAKSDAMKDNFTMALNVQSGSSTVATAGFVKAGSKSSLLTLAFSSGERQYWQVLFSFTSSSKSDDYAAETMYALIQTCDPSLSKNQAHEVGSEVIANYESLGSGKGVGQASRNGITYSLANSNGWMVSAKVG